MSVRAMCDKTRHAIVRSAAGLLADGGRPFAGSANTRLSNKLEMFHKRLDAENIGRKFVVPEDTLADVSRRISIATDAAVAKRSATAVKCWDTLVGWPLAFGRSPARRYLGLDLSGGTQFQTRLATRSDTDDVMVLSQVHPLAAGLRVGSGRALFDHMAHGLAEFLRRQRVRASGLPLAFTFGFPVRHVGHGAAVLDRWTKEFDCADFVQRDVVSELRASLDRAGLAVQPLVLLNDTSTAMANLLTDEPATRVGLVVDDGCNCSYAERSSTRHAKFDTRTQRAKFILKYPVTCIEVVDTELGAFGDDGALNDVLTTYDRHLDAQSRHPGKQIFEKMTSGMYMGELVRRVVLEMINGGVLFDGKATPAMLTEYWLNAAHLARVESDARGTYAAGRSVLAAALGVARPTDADCDLFRYACECVTKRSAHLVAAGLASVLRRVNGGRDGGTVVVAIGGSVFETHDRFASTVGCMTRRLLRGDCNIKFGLRMSEHS